MARRRIFSGEPMPVAPQVKEPELASFHYKLLEYLRRLAAKIDANTGTGDPGTGAATLVFGANLTAAFEYDDSGYIPIVWDNVIRSDTPFSHSAGTITLANTGFYVVELDLMIFKNLSTEVSVRLNGVEIDWGHSKFTPNTADDTWSLMVPFTATSGDDLTLEIKNGLGLANNFLGEAGTRVLVAYYPAEA